VNSIRVAVLCFVVSLFLAPQHALAQGGAANNLPSINARLTALEATVAAEKAARLAAEAALQNSVTAETNARATGDTTLQGNINTLTTQVNKLRGIDLTSADFAGSYGVIGTFIDVDGGNPANVEIFSVTGTATLLANGQGTLSVTYRGIGLEQGTPWTDSVFGPEGESIEVTWGFNPNGTIKISDGTVNLDIDFNVGAGGRVWTYGGISDDDTVDMVVLTRLQ
jgi:hypothetical protein